VADAVDEMEMTGFCSSETVDGGKDDCVVLCAASFGLVLCE
jgi:hypothetical protein